MPTQNQFLNQTFFTLSNVLSTPQLLSLLAAHGYDEKAIKRGLMLHAQVETTTETRDAAQGVVRSTNRSLQQAKEASLVLFGSHLVLARTAFKREGYPDDMKITGRRAGATEEWLSQAKKFYLHVPADLMAKYNVSKKELMEAQKMVAKVMELLALQQKTRSQAQQLTQERLKSYEELHAWMKKFMRIARAVLTDHPQQLEALGLVVKA